MRVTFLGTGSAMPSRDRVQTGILVETGGSSVLVDCGSGVLHALSRTDVGYRDLDCVLLTHLHLDHVSDLLALLKARWLTEAGSLCVVGPPGTTDLLTGLLDVFDYLDGRLAVDVRDRGTGTFAVAGVDVAAYETHHSVRTHAYRLDDAFTFSADADLAAFAAGTTLAHDCSFPDDVESPNHATPTALGRALAGRAFDGVYLTHCYPHTDGRHEEMLAAVRAGYDGDVAFAHDGLVIDVD